LEKKSGYTDRKEGRGVAEFEQMDSFLNFVKLALLQSASGALMRETYSSGSRSQQMAPNLDSNPRSFVLLELSLSVSRHSIVDYCRNTYSALSALAGHYNSFGPETNVPKKRLDRLTKVTHSTFSPDTRISPMLSVVLHPQINGVPSSQLLCNWQT